MPASELFCPSALKVEGLWFSDVGRVGGYEIIARVEFLAGFFV